MSKQRLIFRNRNFASIRGEPEHRGTVELYVDWEKLVVMLGSRAAWNRSQRSKLGVGIEARFIPDKHEEAA